MGESKATRARTLFKKHKKLIRSRQELTQFQEPVLFLIRRSRKVEFYENSTSGEFEYEHSDGDRRHIQLATQYQVTFDYADKNFRGYICHEDFPTPLPFDPVLTTELYEISIDKVLNDMKKWKAEELKARGELWFKILLGLAILVAAYTLYQMLSKSPTPLGNQTINQTANTTIILKSIIGTWLVSKLSKKKRKEK